MSRPAKIARPVEAARPKIHELAAQWARAKVVEETARREADAKREELLAAGVTIGYRDEHLVVAATSEVDVDDERLLEVLRKEGVLTKVQVTRISLPKVRAAAELNPRVSAVLAEITTTKLRFEQAAKKRS